MALVSGGRSTLNPNAPLFVPAVFRQVEDFSPEWWQLVTTSTWYRDYWLSLHPEGFFDQAEDNCDDVVGLLPDSIDFGDADEFASMDSQFEEFIQFTESEGNKLMDGRAMNAFASVNSDDALKTLDANGFWSKAQPAIYADKPAKNVGMKYSPRYIQQPR